MDDHSKYFLLKIIVFIWCAVAFNNEAFSQNTKEEITVGNPDIYHMFQDSNGNSYKLFPIDVSPQPQITTNTSLKIYLPGTFGTSTKNDTNFPRTYCNFDSNLPDEGRLSYTNESGGTTINTATYLWGLRDVIPPPVAVGPNVDNNTNDQDFRFSVAGWFYVDDTSAVPDNLIRFFSGLYAATQILEGL